MAQLVNQTTQQVVFLLSLHLIGRHAASCHTVIDNPKASRIHASVSFNGSHWLIQDNSTNGTFINGKRIDGHANVKLALGDEIFFSTAEAGLWKVVDLSAPKNMLQALSEQCETILLDRLTVIPSEDDPQICLYLGADNRWICEQNEDMRILCDGDKVSLTDNISWQFVEACGSDTTVKLAPNIDGVEINAEFVVSQSEEHVALCISCNGHRFDMGERSHHYLFLLLARQYLGDKGSGVVDSECGWIDRELLIKMLGMEEAHINMQVYRFRKQFSDLTKHMTNSPQLIERRKGQLRFVCKNIQIFGGLQG